MNAILNNKRFGITPVFWCLFIFFLVNSLLLNKILSHWQTTTVLDYSNRFVTVPVHGYRDSWAPMWRAVNYLDEPHDQLLYQKLFFEEDIKFQYAPTSLLLVEPFKRMPLSHLTYMMNLLSWLSVCIMSFYACRIFLFQLRGERQEQVYSNFQRLLFFLLWLYLTIMFYPVVRSWRLGQVQTFNNLLFSIALWKYIRGGRTLPGVLMGLVCVLKPHYSLLLIWGLIRRQKNFVLGLLGTLGCAVVVSVLLYDLGNHVDYLSVLSYIGKHGESFHANQSLNGLLNRALFNGNNLEWNAHGFPPYHTWVYIGTILAAGVLIVTSLLVKAGRSQAGKNVETMELLIAVLCITMASPIAWEHHYGFMLPMFAYVVPLALRLKSNRAVLIGVVTAYVLSSNYYQVTDGAADSAFNVIQSYLFTGALLFLACMYVLRRALIKGEEAAVIT